MYGSVNVKNIFAFSFMSRMLWRLQDSWKVTLRPHLQQRNKGIKLRLPWRGSHKPTRGDNIPPLVEPLD